MTRRTYDLLTASPANVQANPPTSRLYQWLRNGSAISGATGQTYMTTEEDDGTVISVQQTETNFLGTATLSSLPSAQQVSSTLTQRVAELFANNEQGAWYDPSDFSTLYQDAAGTTPVTAVEQPVRLMLDRSRGLVLGSELVTNGGFDSATGWTVPAGWAISGGQAVATATSGSLFGGSMTTVSGRWYQVEFDVVSYTSGNLFITIGANYSGNPTLTGAAMAPGRKSVLVLGGANTTRGVEFYGGSITATIDNISVRELPGNHAVAPNDASRPVLRARYNLLTRTEEFDDAAWGKDNLNTTGTPAYINVTTAPDGTTTADKMIENTANAIHRSIVGQTVLVTSGVSYTFTVYAKAAERRYFLINGNAQLGARSTFDLQLGTVTDTNAGTANITSVGNGWYRCSVTGTAPATSAATTYLQINTSGSPALDDTYTGDGTSGIYIWGAPLLTAADHAATGGAYQRVGAATDYDTGPPWRPYLAFDGSDDSMSTSSIDFSGTDKMTVFAGVTKLSDAAFNGGMVVELTASSAANDGAFDLLAPDNVSPRYYFWRSKGTTRRGDFASSAVYAAPVTNVLTGIGDISGDLATLRINGTQIVTDTGDQGTGNYANAALFIGRRNNTSLPFNGRLYGLTVLGRTATAAEITRTEMYMASKTGVNLS